MLKSTGWVKDIPITLVPMGWKQVARDGCENAHFVGFQFCFCVDEKNRLEKSTEKLGLKTTKSNKSTRLLCNFINSQVSALFYLFIYWSIDCSISILDSFFIKAEIDARFGTLFIIQFSLQLWSLFISIPISIFIPHNVSKIPHLNIHQFHPEDLQGQKSFVKKAIHSSQQLSTSLTLSQRRLNVSPALYPW